MSLPLRPRFRKPIKEAEHRINEHITAPEVRVVKEDGATQVYKTKVAVEEALNAGVDLVEISPNAVPPVCKMIDYNKFLYERKKKEKELKSKVAKVQIKEIRFTANTDDHDINFKAKHAESFLQEGNKVKAILKFKGRAIVFKERGELLLLQFAKRLEEVASVEQMPQLEGKRMMMTLAPKKKK